MKGVKEVMKVAKKELATRCELALNGRVVSITNSEVQTAFEYICSAVGVDPKQYEGGDDVLNNRVRKYTKTNNVAHIVVNTIWGKPCIAFLLKSSEDEEESYPDPFVEDYGTGYPCAFTYVMNLGYDDCSEFGDAFFKKHADGFYHRVS